MMMSDFCMEGGCGCSDVRYKITIKPMFVHCCHCRDCQRLSGSAFAINALVESTNVHLLQGETERITVPTPSGMGQQICRCSNCKTAVWSYYGGAGDKNSFIRVGSLDEPDLLPPDIHIYTRSKQPWVSLPEGIPTVEDYYDPNDYWPEESLERRKVLYG